VVACYLHVSYLLAVSRFHFCVAFPNPLLAILYSYLFLRKYSLVSRGLLAASRAAK